MVGGTLSPGGGITMTALTRAGRTPPDLAIVDLGRPDLGGADVVRGPRRRPATRTG